MLCVNKNAIFHIEAFFELAMGPHRSSCWLRGSKVCALMWAVETVHSQQNRNWNYSARSVTICWRNVYCVAGCGDVTTDTLFPHQNLCLLPLRPLNIHDLSPCAWAWRLCSVLPQTGIATVRSGLWQVAHCGKEQERAEMREALWDGPRREQRGLPGCPQSAGMPLRPLWPLPPPALLFCFPPGIFFQVTNEKAV